MDTCGFYQEFEVTDIKGTGVGRSVWVKVPILRIEITKYGVRIIRPKNLQMFKTLPPYFQWNGNHGVTF